MFHLCLLLLACQSRWDPLPDAPATLCAELRARATPEACLQPFLRDVRDPLPVGCLEVICDPTVGLGPEAPSCAESAVVSIALLDEARAACEAQGGAWSWQIPPVDTRCPHSAPDVTTDATEQERLFPRPIHVACERIGG